MIGCLTETTTCVVAKPLVYCKRKGLAKTFNAKILRGFNATVYVSKFINI